MGDTNSFRLLRVKRLDRGCQQHWSLGKACPLAKEHHKVKSGHSSLPRRIFLLCWLPCFSIGLYHGHGILRGSLRTPGLHRVLLDSSTAISQSSLDNQISVVSCRRVIPILCLQFSGLRIAKQPGFLTPNVVTVSTGMLIICPYS